MEEREIMSFKDEDGNKIDLEVVADICLGEKEYLILAPLEGDEDDAYVFRVDVVGENEEFNLVEDDKEFEAVKKEYKKSLYS